MEESETLTARSPASLKIEEERVLALPPTSMTRGKVLIDFTGGPETVLPSESPPGLPKLSGYHPTGSNDALVLDAGSWQFRAGYASKDLPACILIQGCALSPLTLSLSSPLSLFIVVFDPIVHRYQVKTGDTPQHLVGRTAPTGVTRFTSRTPYEEGSGNLILHQASLEQIFDHTFGCLSLPHHGGTVGKGVGQPILMTETVANPPYCRRECSELLFEAYGAPRVAYAIDGLLSWSYNNMDPQGGAPPHQDAIIICLGHHSTVITMILEGTVRMEHVKRLEVGGRVASDLLLQLMQCKYPSFPVRMSRPQADRVLYETAQVALNYDETLEAITRDPASWDVTLQYPYTRETAQERREREARQEAIAERRRELAQRLRERAEKQRMERIEAKRQQVLSLQRLLQKVQSGTRPTETDDSDKMSNNHDGGKTSVVTATADQLDSVEDQESELDLEGEGEGGTDRVKKLTTSTPASAIAATATSSPGSMMPPSLEGPESHRRLLLLKKFGYEGVEELQAALVSEQRELDRLTGVEETSAASREAPDYSLLEVPDDQLTPEQVKEKRRQRLLKNAADARERIRRAKEAIEARREERRQAQERRRQEDFAGWRGDLYEERRQLMTQLRERQKRKEALADRRSQAAVARLRTVVSLVHDDGEDGGGGGGETGSGMGGGGGGTELGEDGRISPTGGAGAGGGGDTTGGGRKRRKAAGGGKRRDGASTATAVMAAEEESGFGDDDADWLVYRQISRTNDEDGRGTTGEDDEETLQRRLGEIEADLEQYDRDHFYEQVAHEMEQAVTIIDKLANPHRRQVEGISAMATVDRGESTTPHGPNHAKVNSNASANDDADDEDEDEDDDSNAAANQLHVNVERCRSVEGLFQPYSILGLEQAGVVEIIEELLRQVPHERRLSLARGIFVTGGASQVAGLQARLQQDLRAIFPTEATLRITFATDPHLDAWRGGAHLARSDLSAGGSLIPWITREWYEEQGGERLPCTTWFTNQF